MPTIRQQFLEKYYFGRLKSRVDLTLEQFTSYFPSKYQQHNKVKTLYKEYTQWRRSIKRLLKRNIELSYQEHKIQKESTFTELQDMMKTNDLKHQTIVESISALNEAKRQLLRQQKQLNQQCEQYLEEMTAMGDAIDAMTVDTVDLDVLPLGPLQQWTKSNHTMV
jgi:DNA repair exonuclease SbcCD ATPase subunit